MNINATIYCVILSDEGAKDPAAYRFKLRSYLAPRDSSPRSSAQNDAEILKFLYAKKLILF
ncbi:MAG: hypothetical protein V1860_04070 [bacterium]